MSADAAIVMLAIEGCIRSYMIHEKPTVIETVMAAHRARCIEPTKLDRFSCFVGILKSTRAYPELMRAMEPRSAANGLLQRYGNAAKKLQTDAQPPKIFPTFRC